MTVNIRGILLSIVVALAAKALNATNEVYLPDFRSMQEVLKLEGL